MMTLNEALKTRQLIEKRIQKARERAREMCAHTSMVKPPLGDKTTARVASLIQSAIDLEKYASDLNAAILRANLGTKITAGEFHEITLQEALELRGHGRNRQGILAERLGFFQGLKMSVNHTNQQVEQIARSMPKDVERNVEAVLHVSVEEIEKNISKILQAQHDLDVAIEAANFTTNVALEPPKPEEE